MLMFMSYYSVETNECKMAAFKCSNLKEFPDENPIISTNG